MNRTYINYLYLRGSKASDLTAQELCISLLETAELFKGVWKNIFKEHLKKWELAYAKHYCMETWKGQERVSAERPPCTAGSMCCPHAAHNPCAVSDGSTQPGGRVMGTGLGWGCNTSFLLWLSILWDTVKQPWDVNCISPVWMFWRSSRQMNRGSPFSCAFRVTRQSFKSHSV